MGIDELAQVYNRNVVPPYRKDSEENYKLRDFFDNPPAYFGRGKVEKIVEPGEPFVKLMKAIERLEKTDSYEK